MADSKLVNEHRAWLKDAEKGKTRACIAACALFVFNAVIAFVNSADFTGFFIFLILLLSLISALCIFFGKGAGRVMLIITELLVIFPTVSPFLAEEEIDFIAMLIKVLVVICVPIAVFVFTYVNFYIRRYFSFMIAYKANKIYL